jgi:SAM-dependent methyltransferase
MDLERIGPEGIGDFFRAFSGIGAVADLGCGDGGFLESVLSALPAYGKAIGIDPSPGAIATASGLFSREPRVSFCLGGAEAMPLPGASIDLAIMSYSMHHLLAPEKALVEVKRVLSPSGALAVQDFVDEDLDALQRLREEYHLLRGEIEIAQGRFMRPIYGIDALEALLERSGFRRARAFLVIKETEPGASAAPRLRDALLREAAGVGDEAVRAGILRRSEGFLERIEREGLRMPPSYLAEWRPTR